MRKSGVCIQPEILGGSTLLQCGNEICYVSHFFKRLINILEKSIKHPGEYDPDLYPQFNGAVRPK